MLCTLVLDNLIVPSSSFSKPVTRGSSTMSYTTENLVVPREWYSRGSTTSFVPKSSTVSLYPAPLENPPPVPSHTPVKSPRIAYPETPPISPSPAPLPFLADISYNYVEKNTFIHIMDVLSDSGESLRKTQSMPTLSSSRRGY